MSTMPNRVVLGRQAGMTLIELMVSLTLGLMLLAAFLALHYSTRSSFNALSESIQLQQNARFALLEMNRDVHMAGAFGCAANAVINNPSGVTSPLYNYDASTTGVMVYNGIASLGAVFNASDGVVAGTPILKVQYGRGGGVVTAGNGAASPTITQLSVQLPGVQSFDASTPVLAIASCGRVDIVSQAMAVVNAASHTYAISNLALPNNVSGGTNVQDGTIEVLQFITHYYYVKNSSSTQGLYVKTLAGSGTVADIPVAELVTGMSVQLGAISGTTIQYANTCGDVGLPCNQIGLVRLGLTLTSSSVRQAGSTSKLSQQYNTTIALRNHGVQPPP